MSFFKTVAESRETFLSYAFTDDPRASKPGYDELLEQYLGNTISGKLVRQPKEVELDNNGRPETKLILTIEVDGKTKGFVAPKQGIKQPFDPANAAHKTLVVWIPQTGNLPSALFDATGGELAEGQLLSITLTGARDTGKQNKALQYSVTASAAPVRMSQPNAADLD